MTSQNARANVMDMTPVQLADFMRMIGEPASCAEQLLKCIYRECAAGFEEMAGLSPSLKEKLAVHASLGTLEPIEERVSADSLTRKVLFRLEDNRTIESALMISQNGNTGRERRTVCVSSQVGCAVGCQFCATGQQGFERNLRPGEILQQALFFLRRYGGKGAEAGKVDRRGWLTNVVFMGMGEPLANYDNVRQAIAMLNWPKGMGLGIHQVTLSTSGLAPQIRQLAEETVQFHFAVSLHAANDKLRDRLVPVNKKYPLDQLMSACREYAGKTGRMIFIEYALFDGVNDSIADAEELVGLLEGLQCRINLITGNPTQSDDFRPSPMAAAVAFQKTLMAGGIRTMLRVPRGADIEAGCGQLKSSSKFKAQKS